jgi:hypothetical protein
MARPKSRAAEIKSFEQFKRRYLPNATPVRQEPLDPEHFADVLADRSVHRLREVLDDLYRQDAEQAESH